MFEQNSVCVCVYNIVLNSYSCFPFLMQFHQVNICVVCDVCVWEPYSLLLLPFQCSLFIIVLFIYAFSRNSSKHFGCKQQSGLTVVIRMPKHLLYFYQQIAPSIQLNKQTFKWLSLSLTNCKWTTSLATWVFVLVRINEIIQTFLCSCICLFIIWLRERFCALRYIRWVWRTVFCGGYRTL